MKVPATKRVRDMALPGAVAICVGLCCGSLAAMPLPNSNATEPLLMQQDPPNVQDALQRARNAAEAGRWQEAADAYTEVLEVIPDHPEARDGLMQALTMLDRGPIVESVGEQLELIRNRLRTQVDDAVARANEYIEQENFRDAQEEVLSARLRLEGRRTFIPQAEYDQRMQVLDTLLEEIDQRRREEQLLRMAMEEEEARDRAEADRQEAQQQREQRVNEQLRRVRQLQSELKYREALQVIDSILFDDPLNEVALTLRDALQTTQRYVEFSQNERQRQFGYEKLYRDNMAATIAPESVMDYPDDWPQISVRRTGAAGWLEPDSNRRVSRALSDNRIPVVDFDGVPLEKAVAYLREVTDVQFLPEWRSLDAIGISRNDTVTLQLKNVAVKTVLERLLDDLGDDWSKPAYTIDDGLVVISSDTALRKRTVPIAYDIRDLLFEVPYFDNAPMIDLSGRNGESGRRGQGGGVGGSAFGGNQGNSNSGPNNGPFGSPPGPEPDRRSREEIVGQIVDLLLNTVDPEGWRENGGDTGSIQELNGNLIITNTPANHRQIEGLLSQLRQIRALQINVEGRFLSVATNWFEKIGVDLDLYFNTNRDAFDQMRAVNPLGQLSDFFGPNGQLQDPLVYTTEVDENGNFVGPVPFGSIFGTGGDTQNDGPFGPIDQIEYSVGPVGSPIRATSGFTPIGVVQDHFNLINSAAQFDPASFAGTMLGANPAVSFGVSFLDDIQVDLLIEATQADRRSVVLTAPRLTLFNGQRAWVAVNTWNFWVTSLTPVTGDGVGIFQPNAEPIPDGVVLDIEAVISADRRYVTMTVITGVTRVTEGRLISAAGAVGGSGLAGGGATTFGTEFTAPEIEASTVLTTVSVPDKGTVLLGGQRLVREVEVETGVPVLSKMPIINRFFTNRLTSKDEESLLILIRPEIIIQQEQEDLRYPGLLDQLGSGAAYFN